MHKFWWHSEVSSKGSTIVPTMPVLKLFSAEGPEAMMLEPEVIPQIISTAKLFEDPVVILELAGMGVSPTIMSDSGQGIEWLGLEQNGVG